MNEIQQRNDHHQRKTHHDQHPIHHLLSRREIRHELPVQERGEREASERHRETAQYHEGRHASHTKDIERDDVLELGVEGAHQHHEHQHTNAHHPLLRRLHEGLVLVGLYTSRPRASTTVVEDVLDAQHGRVRDDGVGEDGVERQQTGGDDVEHAAVINVVDEDVLDATCASPPRPHVST